MPDTIYENVTPNKADTDRYELITECNCCEYYRRGECSLSGLVMTPDDYCSKAVKAEA